MIFKPETNEHVNYKCLQRNRKHKYDESAWAFFSKHIPTYTTYTPFKQQL